MPKGKIVADEIAGLVNTAPKSFDPEEDDLDFADIETLKTDNDISDELEKPVISNLRKQNVSLLSDVDPRYVGKVVSRKSLKYSEDEDSSAESVDDSLLEDRNQDLSSEKCEDESDNGSENHGASNEEVEDEHIDNSDESVEDESESKYDDDTNVNEDLKSTGTESTVKHLSETDESLQVQKGLAVKNQLTMWEKLLETRIQLQKCLVAANRMPKVDKFFEMKKHCGPELNKKIIETKNNVSGVLDKLLTLQKLVIRKYPETKNLDKGVKSDDSDEEIPSDDEDNEPDEDEIIENKISKKRKLSEYESDISEQFKRYKNYRNKVIQKWNEKTSVGFIKSGASNHSVLNQIDHILSDKSRLVKRTQCKRSNYKIIGEEEPEVKAFNDSEEKKYTEEYNTDIFDDDDFYHQLLRELIEAKSADLTDPIQLGRHWIQLQNMRKKMKRNIDTRATKGRKIRYTVHTKLINTMAPIEKSKLTEEAINEIYSSVFGKRKITSD